MRVVFMVWGVWLLLRAIDFRLDERTFDIMWRHEKMTLVLLAVARLSMFAVSAALMVWAVRA
jgi:hypothetical protein